MTIHYLKVALRNLWKYKTNTLISLVCLAIGITCFCMTELMLGHITGFENEYPDSDRRITIFNVNNAEQMKLLEAQQITAFDKLVQYWRAREGEIITVNDAQQEFPFISKYNYVSGNYFEYKNIRLQRNTLPLQAPDEVIISESFAKKAFGDADPVGLTIRRGDDKEQRSFRIIDVALSDKFQSIDDTDVYFNISADPGAFFIVDGILKKGTSINEANEELKQVHITQGERTGHPWARPKSLSFEETLIGIGIQAIGFLSLLSGLINFLKLLNCQSTYKPSARTCHPQVCRFGHEGHLLPALCRNILHAHCICHAFVHGERNRIALHQHEHARGIEILLTYHQWRRDADGIWHAMPPLLCLIGSMYCCGALPGLSSPPHQHHPFRDQPKPTTHLPQRHDWRTIGRISLLLGRLVGDVPIHPGQKGQDIQSAHRGRTRKSGVA